MGCLVLPAERSENAFAVFRPPGAEPVLQIEVTLANVVAAAASVYNLDLSKMHMVELISFFQGFPCALVDEDAFLSCNGLALGSD